MKKYDDQGKQIQDDAQRADDAAEADESRALRYDFGEGLLEIGLVLTSLYFISRKKMFPGDGRVRRPGGRGDRSHGAGGVKSVLSAGNAARR